MTVTSAPSAPAVAMEFGDATSFGEWIPLVANRFVPVTLSTDLYDAFRGSIRARSIDGTHVSDIEAKAHRVQRLATDISARDAKYFKLSLQLAGTGMVAQDGRDAILQKGDSAMYDTSRPYTLEYTGDMRCLIMVFPHDMFGLSAGLICNLTAVRLAGDSGIGRIINPFLQHMADNLEQLSGVQGTRIVRSSVDLITALLSAEQVEHNPVDATSNPTMDAVRLYIDDNLDDPGLNAEKVAHAHYVSLRYLQYLFKQEGQTLSGYIRTRRLNRCRVDLEDPALQSRSILQIAQSWGLPDPSHFSKIFKSTYSVSPREYRAQFTPLTAPSVAP